MSETKAAMDGKGENGRFQHGNKFGCGNPYAREVARLRELALHTLPENAIGDLFAKLYLMAMGGDLAAMRLLLQYTLGKPVECANPDRLDGDELACFRANATPPTVERDLQAAPLEGTLPILRVAKEVAAERGRAKVEQLTRPDSQEGEQPAARSQRRNERPPMPVDATPDREITQAAAQKLLQLLASGQRPNDRRSANTGQH